MWRCRYCGYQVREEENHGSTCPFCKRLYALVSFDPRNDEPKIPEPDTYIIFEDFNKDITTRVKLEDNIDRITFRINEKNGEMDLESFKSIILNFFEV